MQYRAFKEIARHLGDAVGANERRVARQPGTDPALAGVLPELIFNATPEDLRALAEKAFGRRAAEPDEVRLEHLHTSVDSAAERQQVLRMLREAGRVTFQQLVADADAQAVVVVRFMVLLELFRDRVVSLDQPVPLGELTVTWADGESQAEEIEDR
ncbi:segregation/condensation protein A [Nesterenkonia pannonica]|uniref:segregation/condensation protein A n=1 Tax=Nesterenkonia pannonica TaxID=1548602 RepID=UPI002164672D|nr:segregation/condensation protein A [Nesterenkonia pannonica]